MTSSLPPLDAAERFVLVVPETDRSALSIRGGDRVEWLNGLVTCDVKKIAMGGAAYGLAVSQKGKVLADLVVFVRADRIVLSVPTATREALREHFERHLVMEDAELEVTGESFFSAHGPSAAALVAREDVMRAVSSSPLDVTGRGGAALFSTGSGDDARTILAEAATALGGRIGDRAEWQMVRIAASVPAFGHDFDATTYPQEASLERRAVSFDKGCYLGQEVVCMLEMRGHVKRKIVPLEVDGPVHAGDVVTDADGGELGRITSALDAPTSSRALAMVKLSHAQADAVVRIGARSARVLSV